MSMRVWLMSEMVRGQVVVCRDFTGEKLARKVWEDSGRIIYVHTEDQYIAHEQDRPHLQPVGFPREDVYCPESELTGQNDPI